MSNFKSNRNKDLIKEIDGVAYMRIPIKTHVIMPNDKLEEVLDQYVSDIIVDGDIIFIAESIISCMQKRLIKATDIKPRKLAILLSKFVYKNPSDLNDPGLGVPETMEIVLREIGVLRVLVAGIVSTIGKLFGKRGLFYNITGPSAREIDGPSLYTIPPYDKYIVLSPKNPQYIAEKTKAYIKNDVMIVDINDLGANILGNSTKLFSNDFII